MRKKYNSLDAESELWESEKNLENLELIHKFHAIYKEGIINDAEFKIAKHHIMYIGGSLHFKKSRYERFYLEAIPILHELLTTGRLTESQYHEAIPLVVKEDRDVNLARYLRAGLINFDDFHNPDKSKLLNWLTKRRIRAFGVTSVDSIVLDLYEKHGFHVVQHQISNFGRKLGIILEKDDVHINVYQSPRFFGRDKIYVVGEDKKKLSYDNFIKLLN